MKSRAREVILTFDVEGPPQREDFIEPESIRALFCFLNLLNKYDLPALFFLTAAAAEKLAMFPEILELLASHEIGYHSSSHSAAPRIFEYTDVESYGEAIEASLERENSSVDLFTGDILGKGGIHTLREIFSGKEIISFRAPFLCWSPPHLEALRELGFRFDLSANISASPSFFKGMTFMPYPTPIDSMFRDIDVIFKRIINEKVIVLLAHPSHTVFKSVNSSRKYRNAFIPVRIEKHSRFLRQIRFLKWEMLLHGLSLMHKRGVIDVKSRLGEAGKPLDLKRVNVREVYETSIRAPEKIFGCEPKFLLSHFYHFFEK